MELVRAGGVRALAALVGEQAYFGELGTEPLHLGIVFSRIIEESCVLLGDPCVLSCEIFAELCGEIVLHFSRLLDFLHLYAQEIEVRRYLATQRFCLVDITGRLFELTLALRFFVLIELETERVFHHFAAFLR